ncbi:ATP12 family chaperone protein [Amaricoccus tamworthensis]|uniref:ATP12 family chaperone protein n=1 Tax=Amaricoccus tamworthensis TaxID=57002 RepID=UPI003C7CEC0C
MSFAARKRFWKEVSIREENGLYRVELDGRAVKTPAKRDLMVAQKPLAEAVAEEWRALDEEIDPEKLPYTRYVNVALDRLQDEAEPVVEMVAEYGGNDLICYRTSDPEGLCLRQRDAWDPWLAWARSDLSAPLYAVEGVMHQDQPAESLAALRAAVADHEPVPLAALYELVTLSGSLVLGLAVSRGALVAGEAWDLSRVDETWQAEQWGRDAEADELAQAKRSSFLRAAELLKLCNNEA